MHVSRARFLVKGRAFRRQPTVWRLPLEVWESILEYLQGDPEALAACALTCHAFLPTARHLYFHAVNLVHDSRYLRFVKLLRRSPHIARCVHDLSVTVDSGTDHPTLPLILPRLHKVERLTLDFAGGMFEMTEGTRHTLVAYFQSTKYLRIQNVRFDGVDLLQILCACPMLSTLHLCSVRWRRSALLPAYIPDLAAIAPTCQVVLHELTLQNPPPQVVAWLAKGPFKLQLHTLELLWDSPSDTKYLQHLFEAAGTSLHHLTLAFPGWFSHEESMDLSYNTRLRTLRLYMICIDGSQPRYVYMPNPVKLRTYEWVPAALSQLRSLDLQQIHFSIELCKNGDLAVLDWEQIDRHLARMARDAGQLVTTFHVRNDDFTPATYDVMDAIMYRLPILRGAKGRLGIVYAQWPEVDECWFP